MIATAFFLGYLVADRRLWWRIFKVVQSIADEAEGDGNELYRLGSLGANARILAVLKPKEWAIERWLRRYNQPEDEQ